jgi:hypothetical protein
MTDTLTARTSLDATEVSVQPPRTVRVLEEGVLELAADEKLAA